MRRSVLVEVSADQASSGVKRTLLGLIATSEDHEGDSAPFYDEVMVYLHGFPDMAVHPVDLDFASRMPAKLCEFWLNKTQNRRQKAAFVTFNFGGVPGSDQQLRFTDKTIAQELEDAVAVCRYVRCTLLKTGKLHVVGLSTGAIIASLLREKQLADSIAVIAGLLDLKEGVKFDFSPLQLEQCDATGSCWKEFYLPKGCPLPKNVDLSLDGAHSTSELTDATAPSKLFVRLNQRYVQECQSGSLDIRRAVSGDALPPLLVIHGDADQNVPFSNGEELFEAAAEPKTFLPIPRANHLLTNSKLLKKALKVIGDHIAA
ncbi:hypothetical protein PHYBOEH_003344, partial [Phytophthora boehmeriae]